MKATALLAMLVLGLLAVPLSTDAQPAGKVYRIGRLSPGPPPPEPNPCWRPSGRGCASSAMSRVRTSSLSTAMRRGRKSGSPTWRPSWSGSRWT